MISPGRSTSLTFVNPFPYTGIPVSTFLTPWVMTLFAAVLPVPCVFHIMDYLLAFGHAPDNYKAGLEVCVLLAHVTPISCLVETIPLFFVWFRALVLWVFIIPHVWYRA
jgi:hypothetical protein